MWRLKRGPQRERFPHLSQQDNTVLPAYQVDSDKRIKLTAITGTTMVSQIGHNGGHENKAVTSYADRATEASLSVHRLIGGH